jgi:mannan endo-1,4-beta-mannosidase
MSLLTAILFMTSVGGGTEIIREAEDAALLGVYVDTVRTGFSGWGYVTGFDQPTDSLRITVQTGDGLYGVWMATAQSSRLRSYRVAIDGEEYSGLLFNSGRFREQLVIERRLGAGEHVITVHAIGVDVDYLRLAPVAYDPPARPPRILSDPAATPATQALFNFLIDEYGRHILSGQQDLDEVEYVGHVTGRTPAVGVFDLIDYSPSRIQYGASPYPRTEHWINWAASDALVSLSWHWNAPTDLINTSSQPWWRGFYTEATTFDIEAVLADTTSERYGLLLRDMDAIAVQLGKFQSADVPVLWRPLHEAWGGWFWWGARGAEPFKELWRLLYDRLVRVHDLHNLIWVYTHEDPDWYPGDEFVDIVSRDIYSNDPHDIMRGVWDSMQEQFGGHKLVALSESGTLPDPDAIVDFGVWWSWFSVWNGSFIRDIPQDYLTHVFTSEYVLTRDELPDWRAGALTLEQTPAEGPDGFDIYPNPAYGSAWIRIELPVASAPLVEIYDLLGRVVRRWRLGFQPRGMLEVRVEPGLAAGAYVVRVRAPGFSATSRLAVVP